MSSKEWKKSKLRDLCTKIGSGATPRGGKETYLDRGPYALIRSQNVLDFFFSYDGLAYINSDQASQLDNVDLQDNDVLLNITGDSVARVCQVPKVLLPARVNQHVSIVRPDSSKLIPAFLKYYLLNPRFKNFMLGLASVGGTRNALTKSMIDDFEIELPPLPTQCCIAEILSALDDKIELNRQTNATLEAIAQAIFKEWFVDFKFPGATGEMIESELGLIPRGWKVVPIGELFDYVIGGDWGFDEQQNEEDVLCSIIRGTDLENVSKGMVEAVPHRYIKHNSFCKRVLREGDIILEISGGSKDQATGRNLWVSNEMLTLFELPVVATSFCRLIRPVNIELSVYLGIFLSGFYKAGGTWDYQLQSTGISNFQFVDFSTRHKLVLPDIQSLGSFHRIMSRLIALNGLNSLNNHVLLSILNLLLPRLMEGSQNFLESPLH
jgi:type I restriction enzyme S subunit